MLLHAFVQQTAVGNPVFAGVRLVFVQTASGHNCVPGRGLDKSHVSLWQLSCVLCPGIIWIQEHRRQPYVGRSSREFWVRREAFVRIQLQRSSANRLSSRNTFGQYSRESCPRLTQRPKDRNLQFDRVDAKERSAGMICPGHTHHSILRFKPLTDCTNLYLPCGTTYNIMLIIIRVLYAVFYFDFPHFRHNMYLPIFCFGCVFGLLFSDYHLSGFWYDSCNRQEENTDKTHMSFVRVFFRSAAAS